MARRETALLRDILRSLRSGEFTGTASWDLLIRQARKAGLLARLGLEFERAGLLPAVPARVRAHLDADLNLADQQIRDVHREVRAIRAALSKAEIPFVLLKGAAYVLAGLPAARGRIFNDIDIMVSRDDLIAAEKALLRAGWLGGNLEPYDEQYYRLWMHQIPPMTHVTRGTTVDVHHSIVAPTRRLSLDSAKLFASAVESPTDPLIRFLAPADMVLHSAAHLLTEGNFDRGLRDLDDINLLLRHFGGDPGFWPMLVERAAELDLRRPLFYAFRYASAFLGTKVPEAYLQSRLLAPPGPFLRGLADPLFEQAFRPRHPSCQGNLSGLASAILYLRGHYLLMPLPMLVPHLWRKTLKSFREEEEETVPVLDMQP